MPKTSIIGGWPLAELESSIKSPRTSEVQIRETGEDISNPRVECLEISDKHDDRGTLKARVFELRFASQPLTTLFLGLWWNFASWWVLLVVPSSNHLHGLEWDALKSRGGECIGLVVVRARPNAQQRLCDDLHRMLQSRTFLGLEENEMWTQ